MKQSRLDALADGVFAIVMTLLVLEFRVPELDGLLTNQSLWEALLPLYPSILSYILSFALLFTYWRGHHYIATVYARNIDNTLSTINAIFLLFVALVPFTTHLLGLYNNLELSIAIYGFHMIIIGLLLYSMRFYISSSETIENMIWTKEEYRSSTIRILLPVFIAFVAIIISLYNTQLSLVLYTFAIIFNLSSTSTRFLNWCYYRMFKKNILE